MDIERLKEDIRNIEYDLEYGEEQNQGRIAVNVNCLRSAINFANEAIARQSVTSEEVAEKLSKMPQWKIDFANDNFCQNKYAKPIEKLESATCEVQEAIDFMENELKILESFTSKYECFSKNISIFKTILTALQAYQPWVSVADRLPESDDGHQNLVLVLDIGGNYEIEMPSHIIRNIEDYTHWKSLPEPPKGE